MKEIKPKQLYTGETSIKLEGRKEGVLEDGTYIYSEFEF